MERLKEQAPYERLVVYQKSYQAALETHKISLGFPKIEQYELGSQLRRSSKSIVVNLVEGMGRQNSPKEVSRYLQIAMGSCDESRIWLNFAKDLGYLNEAQHQHHSNKFIEIGKMLRGLISTWQAK